MSCAETAERIDVPFGMKTRVGQRNHKLKRVDNRHGKEHFLRGVGPIGSTVTVSCATIRRTSTPSVDMYDVGTSTTCCELDL